MRKGSKMTVAARKKMSKNHANVSGEKNPMFGKKHNAVTIKRMSDAQSGEKHYMYDKTESAVTRKKMSDANRGEKNPNYKHGKCGTKEYECEASNKRRAAKKNQTPELTEIEKNRIIFIYEVCGTMADYHVDHIQPLSKGGLHHPDNLQILDKQLNLEKHNKWPLTEAEQVKYKGEKI